MLAVLVMLNAGLAQRAGAGFIDRVDLCATLDCTVEDRVAVDLPYRIPRERKDETTLVGFVLTLPDHETHGARDYLYMPSAPRDVAVAPLRETLRLPHGLYNTWRQPVVTEIDPVQNEYRLVVAWHSAEGLTLYPMRFGTRVQVKPYADRRRAATFGLAVTSIVLSLAIFCVSVAVVAAKRDERVFFWLAASSPPALFVAVMYARQSDLVSPSYDIALIVLATMFYVSFVLRFVNRLMEVHMPVMERFNLLISYANAVAVILTPPAYLVPVSAAFASIGIVWALVILVVVVLNTQAMGRSGSFGLYTLLVTSLSLGSHEMIMYTTELEIGPMLLGQALPAVMGASALWLLVRRLQTSLADLGRMNETLESAVVEKTRELEENYELVTASRTSAALDEERRRMLIELHDGVGGHITNILAYVEESGTPDPVLEDALEDALREIGVIMDGLTSLQAPLPAVLGSLRHRYEPLLDRLGIRIDWRVSGDDRLPQISPERMMDFVRLVQEALNNAVKHAQASKITVETRPNAVVIEDDGIGLSQSRSTKGTALSSGLGIASMTSRATRLGGTLTIEDVGHGTRVTLKWPSGLETEKV